MRITYLGHAGFCVETSQATVIMDPWLSPTGAFDAAWFQFPRNHHLRGLLEVLGILSGVALKILPEMLLVDAFVAGGKELARGHVEHVAGRDVEPGRRGARQPTIQVVDEL